MAACACSQSLVAFVVLFALALTTGPTLVAAQRPTCPAQSVLVETAAVTVCVDRFENVVATWSCAGPPQPNAPQSPCWSLWPFNEVLDPALNVTALSLPSVRPQGYVSADQGAAACANAGKRLCTLDEWLAACQGPENFTYPYGDQYEPGFCNEGRATNPVNDLFGPNATFNYTEMNDPRLLLLPNTSSPTGAFAKCQSAWGLFDMSGNMDEWINHINEPAGTGTFKGGFFVDAKINGPGCLYRTIAHATRYHDYSLGFRCCADPWQEFPHV